MQKWSQDQAVAFECAREVITDMMAIQTGLIAFEYEKENADLAHVANLRIKRSKLAIERSELHVNDDAEISRIRTEYGVIIRTWREENHGRGSPIAKNDT